MGLLPVVNGEAAQDLAGYWRTQKEVVMDVWAVLRGPERRAVRLALVIAFLDQGMASTAIVNYAPQVGGAPFQHCTIPSSACQVMVRQALPAHQCLLYHMPSQPLSSLRCC